MPPYDEITLATLIRSLPPAPEQWVEAATEIPRTKRELDALLPQLERDAELREAMSIDLEAALEQAGVEPRPQLVDALRRRLGGEPPSA
jgi:hypothetical protein